MRTLLVLVLLGCLCSVVVKGNVDLESEPLKWSPTKAVRDSPSVECVADAIQNTHDGLQVVRGFCNSLLGLRFGKILAVIVGFIGTAVVGAAVVIDFFACLTNQPTFL